MVSFLAKFSKKIIFLELPLCSIGNGRLITSRDTPGVTVMIKFPVRRAADFFLQPSCRHRITIFTTAWRSEVGPIEP